MAVAIIGGTGLDSLDTLTITRREPVSTPFGDPAAALSYGVIDGEQGPVEETVPIELVSSLLPSNLSQVVDLLQ